MKRTIALLLLLLLAATPALAKHKHREAWYQAQWCEKHGGQTEYILPDKTRVDCLTRTHAWEFDFARGTKPYEAVGQALHYGRMTGKRPGIVLIIERGSDHLKVYPIQAIIRYYDLPIDLETIVNSGAPTK